MSNIILYKREPHLVWKYVAMNLTRDTTIVKNVFQYDVFDKLKTKKVQYNVFQGPQNVTET